MKMYGYNFFAQCFKQYGYHHLSLECFWTLNVPFHMDPKYFEILVPKFGHPSLASHICQKLNPGFCHYNFKPMFVGYLWICYYNMNINVINILLHYRQIITLSVFKINNLHILCYGHLINCVSISNFI